MSRNVDPAHPRPTPFDGKSEYAAWQTLLDSIPYSRHLGLEVQRHNEAIFVQLPYRDAFIGNFMLPALHGGVIGALIEITARIAAQREDTQLRSPRILGSNIHYLRSATAQITFANAEIVRQGRRTSLVRVSCWQGDTTAPIANGVVQLLFSTSEKNQDGIGDK